MAAHVLVGAILLRDAAILLGRRAPARTFYPGVWDVFGGHVEQNETLEQALARELQEELGINPVAFAEMAVINVVEEMRSEPTEPLESYEYHLYLVTQWTGTPQNVLLEEHSEIRWVPLEEAPQLELASPKYLPIFRRLAAGEIAL